MVFKLIKHPSVKCLLEDCILPFTLGFLAVLVISWLRLQLSHDKSGDQISTFRDNRTGQVFLKRHGVQETEEDLLRPTKDLMHQSLVAPASSGFNKKYILTRTRTKKRMKSGSDKKTKDEHRHYPLDPVGAIWSWPRIEAEAPSKPNVWVVTPTFRNPNQYAELTRVAQALYPCRKFVRWLVVDDSTKSMNHSDHLPNLRDFLDQFKIMFKLIKSDLTKDDQMTIFNPKGVPARRTAIAYIRKNKLKGVVYFADDDNTYDSDIFRQMQSTKKISVWPTGAITEWTVSGPVVNSNGTVVDFFDAWTANRRFPLDFASFAVNTELLFQNPSANIPWIQGYEETIFLSKLKVRKEEFQPLAANATEVLTWHTKTIQNPHGENRERLQKALNQLPYWPKSVQKLVEKYKFLFDSPLVTERPPPPLSKYKKRKQKSEIKEALAKLEIENETEADDMEETTEEMKEDQNQEPVKQALSESTVKSVIEEEKEGQPLASEQPSEYIAERPVTRRRRRHRKRYDKS